MSKKQCKNDNYEKPENPKFRCKKCGRLAKKKEQLHKPSKI